MSHLTHIKRTQMSLIIYIRQIQFVFILYIYFIYLYIYLKIIHPHLDPHQDATRTAWLAANQNSVS